MASSSSSSSLLVLLIFLVSTFSATSSTSSSQLFLPLNHRHSGAQEPVHRLLKSSSLRSSARFRKPHQKQQQQQQVSLPLSSGSDYTLTLSLSPSTSVNLFMDTGSDLVWFPCSPFQCILCDPNSTRNSPPPPPPPPPNSRPVPCYSPACSAAHSSSSLSSSDLCAVANCPLSDIETSSCSTSHHCPQFYYAYGDGSLTARLLQGPLSLLNSSVSFPNFTFACAHSALNEPVGVAGFGRGVLSLPNQLSSLSPSLGARFSYCLVSHSFQSDRMSLPSPLILGRSVEPELPFVYTPLLKNIKYPYFYSVGLVAISVGETRMETGRELREVDREGNGGMVVDSGTTFTMLPSGLYKEVSGEFMRRMKGAGLERAEAAEGETGLSPCFYYKERNDSRSVPSLELHFGGEGSMISSVLLPKRNYFMGFDKGGKRVGCLMVMDAGIVGGGGGPAGTLGNIQQQGFEVVYDLEGGRVGFARRRCAALWDALSRG